MMAALNSNSVMQYETTFTVVPCCTRSATNTTLWSEHTVPTLLPPKSQLVNSSIPGTEDVHTPRLHLPSPAYCDKPISRLYLQCTRELHGRNETAQRILGLIFPMINNSKDYFLLQKYKNLFQSANEYNLIENDNLHVELHMYSHLHFELLK